MINLRVDKVDLRWSHSGDLVLQNGDLEDTSKAFGLGFFQEVKTRVATTAGDWKTSPEIGCFLDEFEGQPNTEETAEAIKASLSYALTRDRFLAPSDFEITVIPISEHEILIRIRFLGILTDQSLNSKIVLNLVYDLTGKGPFIVR